MGQEPSWRNNYTNTHTHIGNQFFIGAATNIKHFCKSNLLASLTCFVGVGDKRGEQQREDQRECGVDYHSTAPQRDTRGGCWIKNVSKAVRTKRGRDGGGGVEKRWEMWSTYLTWHVRSARFFELLGSDGDAHISRRFRCWSAERASRLRHMMISPTSLCRCVHLHLPLHSRCPSRQPVSCSFECLSSGDLILSLCRGWPLKDKRLSNHLCASFVVVVVCFLRFIVSWKSQSNVLFRFLFCFRWKTKILTLPAACVPF